MFRIRLPLEVVLVLLAFALLMAFGRPLQIGGCAFDPATSEVNACVQP